MEIFETILAWIYPAFNLSIAIFSFVYIQHKSGVMLGIAYSLFTFTSLSWRVVGLLGGVYEFDIGSVIDIIKYTNALIFVVAGTLIIVAIIEIGKAISSGGHGRVATSPDNHSLGENDLDGC